MKKETPTKELVEKLYDISAIGIVNYQKDVPVIEEAAKRLEELEERVAIMSENKYKESDIRFP